MVLLPFLLATSALVQSASPSLFLGHSYRSDVPRPEVGRAYTPHGQVVATCEALAAAAPDRVRLLRYHTTEEGLAQLFLVISSPGNLGRLPALKAANARLADPRTLTEGESRELVRTQPAFVWLGYSVHGSEPAGTEAALAVAYHFAACQDPEVLAQLEHTVLLLDVTQNPDGRARHLQAVAEALQGENPPDPLDAQNQARWPGGRFNHRLFDLNRDWAWQTQGESRAKARLFLEWNPQVLADVHEMQPENNYFFPPNMQPVHGAIPGPFGGAWQTAFGAALAKAFDRAGFAYFTRDTFDLFYPSYGDSWASLQGAAGMTFECPNPGGLSYLRRDGELLTLAFRVRRHFTSSLATVALAAERHEALVGDFHRVRRERLALGERAGAFLLGEGADPGRTLELVRLLQRNGIEVLRTTAALSASGLEAIALGDPGPGVPAGSYLVALDQPRGPMALALLEKDAAMGPKPSYDATAWSLPLVFNVPAWHAKLRPRVATAPVPDSAPAPLAKAAYGYLLPAGLEGRERLLEALLKDKFRGIAASQPFTVQGRAYPSGSVIFPLHRNDGAALEARLIQLAPAEGLVVALASSAVEAGPDLGSSVRGQVLRAPRVALVMDGPTSPTAVGEVLHTLREQGIPFTQLRAQRLAGADLRPYTHVILVDDEHLGAAYQTALGAPGAAKLKAYAQEGGVLIAMQGGAAFAGRAGLGDGGVSFLARKDEEARLKEKDPKRESPAPAQADRVQPWAEREDRELRETIPGALLRAHVDLTHPLAWGLNSVVGAVFDSNDPVLELSPGGENPIAYGQGDPRLSGLIPKDLAGRLHHSAYLLREAKGKGALILFSGDPLYRGNAPFTTRAFLNALFFGAYSVTVD